MVSQEQVKTRFLILSDTHGFLPNPTAQPELPYNQPFPRSDVAIHCGDLTMTGKLEEHERALTLLKMLPAPLKIVIPGNHDLTLDKHYCRSHSYVHGWHDKHPTEEDLTAALELYTNYEARQAGIVHLEEGTHRFSLSNGAVLRIYASAYTPEFCDWAFAYPRSQDRYNAASDNMPDHPIPRHNQEDAQGELERNNTTVVITHGPPEGVLDYSVKGDHVGCDHLMKAIERCRPLLHCFGHIHEAAGSITKSWNNGGVRDCETIDVDLPNADDNTTKPNNDAIGTINATTIQHGAETVFVNASILDVGYKPSQKPWIVDLMLPQNGRKLKVMEC